MFFIAHRGNTNGKSKDENKPFYIKKAIEKGFDVEIDIWVLGEKIYLGHDKPETEIEISFLEEYKDKLWCHSKNKEALELLYKNFNTFWHQNDNYTITSKNFIWAYPNQKTSGIYVMPELHNTPIQKCQGICSDYIEYYKGLITKADGQG